MKQPTHFIEVYKEIYTSTLFNGVVLPLCDMDTELLITKVIKDLETIAVWKIYPKPLLKATHMRSVGI